MTPGSRRARRGAALARALVLALAPLAACAADEAASARRVGLEELVAEIGPREGGDGDLQPLLVNFWATWCGPCVAELPALDEVAREHAGELRVVAVSLDLAVPTEGIDGPADVAAFAAERGLDLEILVYDGTSEELNARLDLPGPIPYTYARDRHGKVVDTQEGEASHRRFRELAAAATR